MPVNPSTQVDGAGESELKGHPLLHEKFEASLENRRQCLKENKIIDEIVLE